MMRIGSSPVFRPALGVVSPAPSHPAGTFALPTTTGRATSAAPVATTHLPLVLPTGDALDQRRRGAQRGRAILGALDDLQLAMISGSGIDSALADLSRQTGEMDAGGDQELAGILDAIGLRADVELAKAAMRRAR